MLQPNEVPIAVVCPVAALAIKMVAKARYLLNSFRNASPHDLGVGFFNADFQLNVGPFLSIHRARRKPSVSTTGGIG